MLACPCRSVPTSRPWGGERIHHGAIARWGRGLGRTRVRGETNHRYFRNSASDPVKILLHKVSLARRHLQAIEQTKPALDTSG